MGNEHLLQEIYGWVMARGARKPNKIHVGFNGIRFVTISVQDGLTILPVPATAQYPNADRPLGFTWIANYWPDIPIRFHKDCTSIEKEIWCQFIDQRRESFGLPPSTLISSKECK